MLSAMLILINHNKTPQIKNLQRFVFIESDPTEIRTRIIRTGILHSIH